MMDRDADVDNYDGLCCAANQLKTVVHDLVAADSIDDRFAMAAIANLCLDDLVNAAGLLPREARDEPRILEIVV